jgi:SAM-dependent methyltransferase
MSGLSDRVERLRWGLARRLLRGLASRPAAPDGSNGPLKSLLPVWKELLLARSAGLEADVGRAELSLLASITELPQTPELLAAAREVLLRQLPVESWPLVPALAPRAAPVPNTWTFQNEMMRWDIAPHELVLDVGSGGWPFKRADHLADKFPDSTSHRVGTATRDERPFFVVDLEHLPFRDGAYDFVFCSHVLEHMDEPGRAIRELARVGRRGYIEVPTRLSDVMFNFTRLRDHHRWHGLVLADTLVLIEWNDWERRELGNLYFDALHSASGNAFQEFFERNRDFFFASLHWTGSIKYLIVDKNGGVIDASDARG